MKKIIAFVLSVCLVMVLPAQDNKWKVLFDGKNLDQWTTVDGKPVPAGWEISNGTVTIKKGSKAGDIISKNEFANFELSLDFNIETGCNSGVKYFFSKYQTGGNLGMEYQIIDDINGEDNKLSNHLCGSLYDVLPPDSSKKKINPPGKWNNIRIVVKGTHVEHWLNGKKILEFTRGSDKYLAAVAQSKFSKALPVFGTIEKGHILLQEHGGQVSFRNIKIKVE